MLKLFVAAAVCMLSIQMAYPSPTQIRFQADEPPTIPKTSVTPDAIENRPRWMGTLSAIVIDIAISYAIDELVPIFMKSMEEHQGYKILSGVHGGW